MSLPLELVQRLKILTHFALSSVALEYEIARQLGLLKAGNEIEQQTLLFDSDSGATRPMRGKEESSDYRYFPDPDLPPIVIEESWIELIRQQMPRLPEELLRELMEVHKLNSHDASVLTAERSTAEYFEAVVEVCGNGKAAANWIVSELFGLLNREGTTIESSPVAPDQLGALIRLVDADTISGKMAKKVFEEMFSSGRDPEAIVEEQGLKQLTDEGAIGKIVLRVLEQNPEQVEQYLGGTEKVLGFFVGQVMKETQGSANPKLVNSILREKLEERRS